MRKIKKKSMQAVDRQSWFKYEVHYYRYFRYFIIEYKPWNSDIRTHNRTTIPL